LPRWRDFDDLRLVDKVALGLPVSAAETVVRRIDPDGHYVRLQDIMPKSTYYRRKERGEPLSPGESEKVLALSKVFQEALRQYRGDARTAAIFLTRHHPMLAGRTPFEVARGSVAGAHLVLNLLARAEAGVAA
jgi:putative toxin-antitoxin system antitoxin component (TIGR02293 family)